MKTFLYRSLHMAVLLCSSFTGVAQVTDTLAVISKGLTLRTDSIYIKDGTLHISGNDVYLVKDDTVFLFNKHKEFMKLDSLHRLNDSLYRNQHKLFKKNTALYKHKDSISRHAKILPVKKDALFRNTKAFRVKQDSLSRKNDSLYRKSKLFKSTSDSLFRYKNAVFSKQQHNFKRLDSLKSLNWRKDSSRIKGHLERLKSDLQRIKTDSARKDLNTEKKIVSFEVKCDNGATVTINDMGRKLVVKTWDQEKIKIETAIMVEAGFDSKDIDWKRDMNIGVEQQKNAVVIFRVSKKPVAVPGKPTPRSRVTNKLLVSNDEPPIKYTIATIVNRGEVEESRMFKVNSKSELVIYVPSNARLNVVSRFNELSIKSNMISVELDLLNTDLKMLNADRAIIKSKYGSVKAGAIKDADIDLLNCKFTSGDLEKLLINSKYSTISFQNAAVVDIKSLSDKYNIAKADYITANKSFGELNIAQLGNSIKLTGSSADIDIKIIDPSVNFIQVDNKYADIKLPVEKLLNYSLQFEGNHSYVFTRFEKIRTNASDSTRKPNPVFSKIVGDVQKDGNGFIVNCTSCSVDFR